VQWTAGSDPYPDTQHRAEYFLPPDACSDGRVHDHCGGDEVTAGRDPQGDVIRSRAAAKEVQPARLSLVYESLRRTDHGRDV